MKGERNGVRKLRTKKKL